MSFLLAAFDGDSYPFNLRHLRGLDTWLTRACLDYLELDTRALDDVENYLAGGKKWLLAQRASGISVPEDDQ